VTITGVDLTGGSMMRVTEIRMWANNDQGGYDPAQTVPFEPFSLGPDLQRLLVMEGVFAGCTGWARGTLETIVSAELSFTTFGIRRHTTIPLGTRLVIHAPRTCPGRVG
jgi:hypothetical protein